MTPKSDNKRVTELRTRAELTFQEQVGIENEV